MPLPTQILFKEQIKAIITGNENPEDHDKAIEYFCDKLSTLLLDTIKNADVIHMPGEINTIVTTPAGPGTGVNVIPVKGKVK